MKKWANGDQKRNLMFWLYNGHLESDINHEESMKWCDLIGPGGPEPQALNLIWTSHVFCWSIHAFLRRDAICTISRRRFDGDSEVSWRHGMPSDIIYAYIRKCAMLDRLDMTLLLNSESLGNRLWWKTSDGSKSFKNSMSEVLPGPMLLGGFVWCEND